MISKQLYILKLSSYIKVQLKFASFLGVEDGGGGAKQPSEDKLPMTRKEYYVQCTKYQFLKLIRETSQLDLDRCLTSSITQFIGYFKYRIIDAYNPVCNITNCFVCAGS